MDEQSTEQITVVIADEEVLEFVYYYNPAANPNGAFYPGVPLSDLTPEQVESFPEWVQRSIEVSPMYSIVPLDEIEPEHAEGDTQAADRPKRKKK